MFYTRAMTQIPDHLDDVGPGWRTLLLQLHGDLLPRVPGYTVAQVKEKYGTLRVYLDYLDEERLDEARCGVADRFVDAAEAASQHVCEDCGQPGRARRGGWIRTLCDGCAGKGRSAA